MIKYDVLKPFNTVNRRLKVGGDIAENEHIEPWSFDERVRSGFLKEQGAIQAAASNPSPAPATPAPGATPPINQLGTAASPASPEPK